MSVRLLNITGLFRSRPKASPLVILTSVFSLALSGCGYYDSRTAHKAQISLIGISSSDLQACMGIPDKTKKLPDGSEIYEYTRGLNIPSANDSTLFPLQSVVNIIENALGGAGKTCVADVRITDGKVTDLHYGGDNDEIVGADGVCATIARGCVRRPLPSMQVISSNPLGPVKAYRQPQIKPAKSQPVATGEGAAVTPQAGAAVEGMPATTLPDLKRKAVTPAIPSAIAPANAP